MGHHWSLCETLGCTRVEIGEGHEIHMTVQGGGLLRGGRVVFGVNTCIMKDAVFDEPLTYVREDDYHFWRKKNGEGIRVLTDDPTSCELVVCSLDQDLEGIHCVPVSMEAVRPLGILLPFLPL